MAMISSSGSITSPLPDTMNELLRSATHRSASRRRKLRSLRQSVPSCVGARGRLAGGAGEVAVRLDFGSEALEQRECVRGAAGESGQDLALVQWADFAGIAFHHRVAHRYLAVAADGDHAVAAHGKNGGAVKLR